MGALGFCCEPLEESGYTWSHTTILGDLLLWPSDIVLPLVGN